MDCYDRTLTFLKNSEMEKSEEGRFEGYKI